MTDELVDKPALVIAKEANPSQLEILPESYNTKIRQLSTEKPKFKQPKGKLISSFSSTLVLASIAIINPNLWFIGVAVAATALTGFFQTKRMRTKSHKENEWHRQINKKMYQEAIRQCNEYWERHESTKHSHAKKTGLTEAMQNKIKDGIEYNVMAKIASGNKPKKIFIIDNYSREHLDSKNPDYTYSLEYRNGTICRTDDDIQVFAIDYENQESDYSRKPNCICEFSYEDGILSIIKHSSQISDFEKDFEHAFVQNEKTIDEIASTLSIFKTMKYARITE